MYTTKLHTPTLRTCLDFNPQLYLIKTLHLFIQSVVVLKKVGCHVSSS